jgi:hypothetical protein
MRLLDDSLFNLYRKGISAKEDCLERAQYPDEFMTRLAKAERGVFDDDGDAG